MSRSFKFTLHLWLYTGMVLLCSSLTAQDFKYIHPGESELPYLTASTAISGDVNNDGSPDIVIAGTGNQSLQSYLLLNDGSGKFSIQQTMTQGLVGASLDLTDIDGDNDLDLLVSGSQQDGIATEVYLFNQNTGLFELSDIALPEAAIGSSLFVDINGDGHQDISIIDQNSAAAYIFDPSTSTYTEKDFGFQKLNMARGLWFDLGEDGDMDLFLVGDNLSAGSNGFLYEQGPNSQFTSTVISDQANYILANPKLVDFDNDGDLDICLRGSETNLGGLDVFLQEDDQTLTLKHYHIDESTQSMAWAIDIAPLTAGGENRFVMSVTGTEEVTGTNIYKFNSATEKFEMVQHGMYAMKEGAILIEDFNGDGQKEIMLSGSVELAFSGIYAFNEDSEMYEDQSDRLVYLKGSATRFDNDMDLGDFDNDGDLDLIATGYDMISRKEVVRIFEWETGKYQPYEIDIAGIVQGAVSWVDYNGDGLLDFHLAGQRASVNVNLLYQQEQDGSFTEVDKGFVKTTQAFIKWNDYDQDGDMDLLMAAGGQGIDRPILYQQQSDGSFTEQPTGIGLLNNGLIQWIDYDQDGLIDIFASSAGESGNGEAYLYKQLPDHTFEKQSTGFEGTYFFQTAWGDYENDGDMDLVASGSKTSEGFVTNLYVQKDDGSFELKETALPAIGLGDLKWLDYNDDGYDDLVVTGATDERYYSGIYAQQEDGSFTAAHEFLSSAAFEVLVGDIDNDKAPDVIVSSTLRNIQIGVYRNELGPFSGPTQIAVSKSSIDFGQVRAGSSEASSFTITNTGEAMLTIENLTATAPYSLNWNGGALSPNQTQTVEVTFAPTEEGTFNSQIDVVSASGANTVLLTGVAVGDVVTSTEPLIFRSLKLYPNPANQQLNISGLPTGVKSVAFVNAQGQVLNLINEPTTTSLTIDISGTERGIYFLKVSSQNGNTVRKILVGQ